jgi:2-keto-4-pentenoate hydratase
MSSTASPLDAAAAAALGQLTAARAAGRPGPPVRTLLPDGDIGAAYAVQSAWVADQLAAGDRVAGRKIGLTNQAVQAQFGVGQPACGFLLASMDCPQRQPVDAGRLLQPRVEAEVAFVLARDLDIADPGPDDVLAATGAVVAALEIADSRVAAWDISIVDLVADNCAAGLFTLGAERRPPGGLDLAACPMRLWRNDEEVSSGTAAASLGHPAIAVAWLAATARSFGRPLRAGEIILSGSLGPVIPAAPGDRFTAEIGGLGAVTAQFSLGAAP